MSLNPTTWKPSTVGIWIVTAIVVIAIAHPAIHFIQGVLTALDGAIPGGK